MISMQSSDSNKIFLQDQTTSPTLILDFKSDAVQSLFIELKSRNLEGIEYLQSAYSLLKSNVKAIYTLNELQPISITLIKKQGSCSQRFACLEGLARASGIMTRVKALWISGSFWAKRFPMTRFFIPRKVLLAWPQFWIEDRWLDVQELFGTVQSLASQNPYAFTNSSESMFDALDHTAIDFEGKTLDCSSGVCSLSNYVVGWGDVYISRDKLFECNGLLQKTLLGRIFESWYGNKTLAQE